MKKNNPITKEPLPLRRLPAFWQAPKELKQLHKEQNQQQKELKK